MADKNQDDKRAKEAEEREQVKARIERESSAEVKSYRVQLVFDVGSFGLHCPVCKAMFEWSLNEKSEPKIKKLSKATETDVREHTHFYQGAED